MVNDLCACERFLSLVKDCLECDLVERCRYFDGGEPEKVGC